ncbi:chymotrypsin-like elastase family member 2A [Amphiura filiformis]|uniref:chymotrypsin-like elastase family member 2A n=1 Tax=Amphiura filiformis TaxID=82378 RepID=UPI003B21D304
MMELQYKNLLVAFVVATFLPNVLPCWHDQTSPYADKWDANKEVCGTLNDNNKIVNGNSVYSSYTWPWLGFMKRSGNFICTVELIAPNWATTAAHCVDGTVLASQLTVTFGQANRASSGTTRRVSQVIRHHGWSTTSLRNDIAILKLSSAVTYTRRVRPVCMQWPGSEQDDNFDDNCWVAGWGRLSTGGTLPNYLQDKKVNVISNPTCKAKASPYQALIYSNHICVENGPTCHGDSGGPLMCKVSDTQWLLLGITSWGTAGASCGVANKPDVFTRMSSYGQWVTDVIDARGGPGTVTV